MAPNKLAPIPIMTNFSEPRNAQPLMKIDVGQPKLHPFRYKGLLPRRLLIRQDVRNQWLAQLKNAFCNLGFNFRDSQHFHEVAAAYNLAEKSREIGHIRCGEHISNFDDLWLTTEEFVGGLRLAVSGINAHVLPTNLIATTPHAMYQPRLIALADHTKASRSNFLVLLIHHDQLPNWILVIYSVRTRSAIM